MADQQSAVNTPALNNPVLNNTVLNNLATDDPERAQLLSQLHDIELPASAGLQIAPIVWILLLLVLVALWFLWERAQPESSRPRQWRPTARQELQRINNALAQHQLANVVPDCSRLARQVALSVRPREQVASLTGYTWLTLLDTLSDSTDFTRGPGQILAVGPYCRHHTVDQTALNELMQCMERLVENAEDEPPPQTETGVAA